MVSFQSESKKSFDYDNVTFGKTLSVIGRWVLFHVSEHLFNGKLLMYSLFVILICLILDFKSNVFVLSTIQRNIFERIKLNNDKNLFYLKTVHLKYYTCIKIVWYS